MSRRFPFQISRDHPPDSLVVEFDEEAANEVFDAFSPETARLMLDSLYTEPQTVSESADSTETSLQNF